MELTTSQWSVRYLTVLLFFAFSSVIVKVQYFRDRDYRDAAWLLLFVLVKYLLGSYSAFREL
jgi:hypothetical protein